jgi:hypothetical protein
MCIPGWHLDLGTQTCSEWDPNNDFCMVPNTVLVTVEGAGSVCQPCEQGCNYCDLDENKQPVCRGCDENDGYVLENGKCYNCLDNFDVDVCVPKGYQCMDVNGVQAECRKCPDECKQCTYNPNVYQLMECSMCEDRYFQSLGHCQ